MRYFNQFIRDKRFEKGLSLREFCKQTSLDPSFWSKVERGVVKQVLSKKVLDSISAVLNLTHEQRGCLIDLALIDSFPAHLKPSEDIIEKLPLLFKTLRGESVTSDELNLLLSLIKN